jgi:hypothetical protein
MWNNHLIEIVEDKTRISELDTILGKKDEEEETEIMGNIKILIEIPHRNFKVFNIIAYLKITKKTNNSEGKNDNIEKTFKTRFGIYI